MHKTFLANVQFSSIRILFYIYFVILSYIYFVILFYVCGSIVNWLCKAMDDLLK